MSVFLNPSSWKSMSMASCEGCCIRFTILKRKRKCEDCGLIFCSECVSVRSRIYQCYRCKILTCVPLNSDDVASLKLRDLLWFVDLKGIEIPYNDRREKPILVEKILKFDRYGPGESSIPPSCQSVCPDLSSHVGGLFGPEPQVQAETSNNDDAVSIGEEAKPDSDNKHSIINLDTVESLDQIYELSAMELKVLLTRNFISFRGICEKSELQEKVCWLWKLREAAKSKKTISDENLCKICMEANIDSLFLDCGHMVTCVECGKQLHDCPICRQIIIRVVRAFKS